MRTFPLTPPQRVLAQQLLRHLEGALQALQFACAYTSVIENIQPGLPGLQELHVLAYIPQSYGLITTTGAVRAILHGGEYTSDYGALIAGCLAYVLQYYQVAGQHFQETLASNPGPETREYLERGGEHGPDIKEHIEEALRIFEDLVGEEEFEIVTEEGHSMQGRIARYRRAHGLDCAPAAYY